MEKVTKKYLLFIIIQRQVEQQTKQKEGIHDLFRNFCTLIPTIFLYYKPEKALKFIRSDFLAELKHFVNFGQFVFDFIKWNIGPSLVGYIDC